MTTKPNDTVAGEETSVMRELELLLAKLHRRFCYPLPIPARIAEGVATDSDVAAVFRASSPASLLTSAATNTAITGAASGSSPSPVGTANVSEEQQYDRVRCLALGVVAEQVPDLFPWQTRVQDGAMQAKNCYQVLQHVRGNVAAMQQVTAAVQEQSDHLSHNASAMMVRKAKLELVRDALEQNLAHFTHIDDLCREAGNPFLRADTARFSTLLQDIANEMEFLSANAQYKSAKPYAMRLAVAQQMVNATLKEAVRQSFKTIEAQTKASPAFAAATNVWNESLAPADDGGSVRPSVVTTPTITPVTTTVNVTPGSGASEALAEVSPHDLNGVTACSSTITPLELRRHDVAGSFADFLASVNDAFVSAGANYTSLRRMAELRQGGFGYAGAEAFGEEMLTASGGIEADSGMREVLDAYRDARVGVVVPLLKYWLTLWYYLDAQDARSEALSATEATQAHQQFASNDSRRLAGVAEAHTLPQLTEHICGLLQRSLAAESNVLSRLWLRDDIASYLLPRLVSSIAEEVYYAFRSRLLCVDDVDELARTVDSIQRVSLRPNTGVQDSQVVADLWLRMIQDTQERLVFRTSVYLRQTVARCTPTREIATVYLCCGSGAYNTATGGGGISAEVGVQTKMFFIPGVVHALQLLKWLYPTLEFSVFSVFAEEAVHHSLDLVRQLVKLMRQADSKDALRDTKAYLCQLSHLQHLEAELSHVDVNITVVERHISFTSLRQSRLEVEQSSRDSKKEVQMELLKCSERLTAAMLAYVTQPMSGAAKKSAADRRRLVSEMKGRAAGVERMIAFYVEDSETRVDLVHTIHERTAELAAEVDVSIQSIPAAPVSMQQTMLVAPVVQDSSSAIPAPLSTLPEDVGTSQAASPARTPLEKTEATPPPRTAVGAAQSTAAPPNSTPSSHSAPTTAVPAGQPIPVLAAPSMLHSPSSTSLLPPAYPGSAYALSVGQAEVAPVPPPVGTTPVPLAQTLPPPSPISSAAPPSAVAAERTQHYVPPPARSTDDTDLI